jgi:hypothetical protein
VDHLVTERCCHSTHSEATCLKGNRYEKALRTGLEDVVGLNPAEKEGGTVWTNTGRSVGIF